MRLDSKLLGLVLAGTVVATVPACTTSGSGYVVATATYPTEPPPPPRQEYVRYRPGYVWISGHWVRDGGNRWRWNNGYYVRERPGYVYVPGRWERRGSNYIWVDGGWRYRGNVTYRRRY